MKYRLSNEDKQRIDKFLDEYNLAKHMLETYGDDNVNQYKRKMDTALAEIRLIQGSVTVPP